MTFSRIGTRIRILFSQGKAIFWRTLGSLVHALFVLWRVTLENRWRSRSSSFSYIHLTDICQNHFFSLSSFFFRTMLWGRWLLQYGTAPSKMQTAPKGLKSELSFSLKFFVIQQCKYWQMSDSLTQGAAWQVTGLFHTGSLYSIHPVFLRYLLCFFAKYFPPQSPSIPGFGHITCEVSWMRFLCSLLSSWTIWTHSYQVKTNSLSVKTGPSICFSCGHVKLAEDHLMISEQLLRISKVSLFPFLALIWHKEVVKCFSVKLKPW